MTSLKMIYGGKGSSQRQPTRDSTSIDLATLPDGARTILKMLPPLPVCAECDQVLLDLLDSIERNPDWLEATWICAECTAAVPGTPFEERRADRLRIRAIERTDTGDIWSIRA